MNAVEARVWLGDDGILRVQYPQNFNLTLDVMEEVHRQRLGVMADPCPLLVYADAVSSAEYEAQQFASRKDIAALTPAMAVIIKSIFTRAMADLFMRFHKPPYPTRFFSKEEDALSWLKQYLADEQQVSSGTNNKPVQ